MSNADPNRPAIALDYTAGPGHAPGVGRYVRELVRALVRLPARNAFPLELLEVGRAPRPMEGAPLGLKDVPAGGPEFARRSTRLPRRLIAQGQRAPGFARALIGPSRRAGLLHRVVPSWPPVGSIPHSIAVAEFPPTGSPAAEVLAAECRAALGVIVFSSDAATRVARDFRVDPSHVFQSPVGSEHWERDLLGASGSLPVDPRPTQDILVLGAIRRARYPLAALSAFDLLQARGARARLLFVGRPGDQAGAFREALQALQKRLGTESIRWIDSPEERRMPDCVAGATVLLHLAEDEASPVTPLEASRMGLPVVASRLPAFEEVFGDRAHYVDAADTAGIADALELGLVEGLNSSLRLERKAWAKAFTWEAVAQAHVDAWKRMLGTP